MEELNQDVRTRSDEGEARERTINAFLGLGEKLISFYNRGKGSQSKVRNEGAIGASTLFDTIEGEIIPRLMLAHREREQPDDVRVGLTEAISAEDREFFVQAVLQDSASAATSYVDTLLQRGISHEDLYLDLLANAARRLGEMWDQDVCDFTEVTIGLCRLHEILRHNSTIYDEYKSEANGAGPTVLLATMCGDQHVFGVVIVAEFFRKAGWRVLSEPGASASQLADILKTRSIDVLGLSAVCAAPQKKIANEIAALRMASLNPDLKILVGGRLFSESPELVAQVGADGLADDARTAPVLGEKLLAAHGVRC